MNISLTPDDLRALASILDQWNDILIDQRVAEYKPIAETVDAISIKRPDTDEVIAHLVFEDDWIGLEFDK